MLLFINIKSSTVIKSSSKLNVLFIIAAQKRPIGLGRQIDNATPWFEPKRIYSK